MLLWEEAEKKRGWKDSSKLFSEKVLVMLKREREKLVGKVFQLHPTCLNSLISRPNASKVIKIQEVMSSYK